VQPEPSVAEHVEQINELAVFKVQSVQAPDFSQYPGIQVKAAVAEQVKAFASVQAVQTAAVEVVPSVVRG
jgi:hypothetical protein